MTQPAAPTPALMATAAMGDTASWTPSPAPLPVPALQLSLTSDAWWQGGIFSHCPAQVGACARCVGNPNPVGPGSGMPEPLLWNFPAPADLPLRRVQLRVRTLQNATAAEVNSSVCMGMGSGRDAHQAAWQLRVPVCPCTPIPWDPQASSRSAWPEGGSASCMMLVVAIYQVPSS